MEAPRQSARADLEGEVMLPNSFHARHLGSRAVQRHVERFERLQQEERVDPEIRLERNARTDRASRHPAVRRFRSRLATMLRVTADQLERDELRTLGQP